VTLILLLAWGKKGKKRKEDEDQRLENIREGLSEVARPVSDGARHHAGIDEVKGVAESPVFFDVINLESEIGWDTSLILNVSNKSLAVKKNIQTWLYGREINPEDL